MEKESFIVRIYRRDRKNPRLIVGTVEKVGSDSKSGFESFQELGEILLASARKGAERRRAGDGRTGDVG